MTAPSARIVRIDGATTALLAEPDTRSAAGVVVEVGSNVASFRTTIDGRACDAIAAPPSIEALRTRPTRWGCAVLFPYPGRVSGGLFTFAGREVRLPVDARTGHAMHGVVRGRPWRVVGHGGDEVAGAWVDTELDSASAGIPAAEWPFPFRMGMRVALSSGRLRISAAVTNTGDGAMPMGLGFHPYFPTPLGPLGEADACEVWVEADEVWERAVDGSIAVRRGATDVPRDPRPLSAIASRETEEGPVRNLTFRAGPRSGTENTGVRAGLRDRANDLAVELTTSPGFGVVGLYTPPRPLLVSLEPMSCVPDALNLASGDNRTGLIVLGPREVWRGLLEIGVSSASAGETRQG